MVEVSVILSIKDESKAKKTLESISDQSFSGIEILCNKNIPTVNNIKVLDDNESFYNDALTKACGKYICILNEGDTLNSQLFDNTLSVLNENKLDFIAFKSNESEIDNLAEIMCDEIFDLNRLGDDIFKMDLDLSTKLISKQLINKSKIQFEDLKQNELIFMWEVIFKSKRFMLLDEILLTRDSMKAPIVNIDEYIYAYNVIFKRFKDYNFLKDFKREIYDYKVKSLFDLLDKITDEEERIDAYKDLKEDFTKMVYKRRYVDFSINIHQMNKLFFDDVVYSKNYEEFSDLIDEYPLKQEIYEISLENDELESEIRDIKNEIKVQNKLKKDILTSSSWKVTEPLRKVKNK